MRFLNIKKESLINYAINFYKEWKYENKLLKEKVEKNRENNISLNIISNKNYIIIFLIKLFILINIFNPIKTNKIDFYYYHDSKISLKIKGISESAILGNQSNFNFKGIGFLKKVYINEIEQDKIEYRYYFNLTDNFVELIWDDNLNSCKNMFKGCINITEIDLSNFNTSQVKFMDYMFYDCYSLAELYLLNLDTSEVIDMNNMFTGCSNLVSLDLSSLDTSNVTRMEEMFSQCSKLISLDLSNFNTSKVEAMYGMFFYCLSLSSLNLLNFNTSQVTDMESMFIGCSSLTSLDLSNFNTSQVTNMDYMFSHCSSLTSLDLSNFNTSQVTNMDGMFASCINLEYINLKNFTENNLEDFEDIFLDIPENVVICINESNNKNIIFPQISNKNCSTLDCSNDWKLKQKKLIKNTNECIESCNISNEYKYEYNGNCVENCPNGILNDDNNKILNKCKCELDKCSICSNVALSRRLCTKCNLNYYPKEKDPSSIGEYINCYNQQEEGYYLDYEKEYYRKCYHTCKKCDKEGDNLNHNCIQCHDDLPFIIRKNDHLNCYENCSYYYFFDNENNFHCTVNFSCPKEYSFLLDNKMECIKYDIKTIIDNLLNYERNETEKIMEKETKYYDNILKNIENEFTSDNYDTFNLDKGDTDIIYIEKLIITLTEYENQWNNRNNNMTKIDLGECETSLRNYYNISSNESIYIKKIDIIQEEMKTLKVEYDVYAKLNGKNLINLNLTICGNSKITIYIPIKKNENIDKLNSSSEYYNDICYTTTSEDGTDISLKDRQKEFINKDYIICQEDCDLSEYNYETFIAKCSCKVKEFAQSFAEMKINKNKLLDNFKKIKNFINFNFLVCYKKLLNKNGIINNIGCYLILSIIIFHIITIFVFSIKQFSLLKNKITKIASEIYKYQPIKKNEKDKKFIKSKNNQFNAEKISIYKNIKSKISKNKDKNINSKKNFYDSQIKINNSKFKKNIKYNKENKKKYIDEEINGFSYSMAKEYDKRTYCQYYASLIKTQHNLICALFNNDDYNSGIIKIDLFFIGFTIEYTINALFYNDDTMHKIYESKGDFDLETQIPIAIYSTIISMILNYPLNFLALSNDAIVNFKQEKSKFKIMKKAKTLKNSLYIKFVLYFISSFLLLLFFWYYISMFCVIYNNTQWHLLKDTLMSFIFSIFIPFLIYLLPGIFRIPALSNKNKKREYLYSFSKFLQSL